MAFLWKGFMRLYGKRNIMICIFLLRLASEIGKKKKRISIDRTESNKNRNVSGGFIFVWSPWEVHLTLVCSASHRCLISFACLNQKPWVYPERIIFRGRKNETPCEFFMSDIFQSTKMFLRGKQLNCLQRIYCKFRKKEVKIWRLGTGNPANFLTAHNKSSEGESSRITCETFNGKKLLQIGVADENFVPRLQLLHPRT